MATIEEVREAVEQQLGLNVREDLWDIILEGHHEQLVLGEEVGGHAFEAAIESLAGTYKDLVRARATGRPSQPQANPQSRVIPADRRLEVLARIFALEAARLPAVALWRDHNLPGGVIGPSAVGEWVRSRALSLDDTTSFATIPLPPGFPPRPPLGRYVDWLERLAEVARRRDLQPPTKSMGKRFEHLQFVAPDEWSEEEARWFEGTEWGGPSEEPRVQRVRVSPNDQLWDLHLLSDQLSLRYGWSIADTTNFVLTGAVVTIHKAAAHIHRRSPFSALTRIGLEVDPRMSAPDVRRLYSQARTGVRKGGSQKMTERHLQLALFIAEDGSRVPYSIGMEIESRTWAEANERPLTRIGAVAPDRVERARTTWPQLQRRWNAKWEQKHPDWHYGDAAARHFSRDARQAWQRVTGQPWGSPTR